MVVILDIEIEMLKNVKWRAWKGTFSGKVIYDSMSEDSLASFRVVPPEKMRPELKAGERVEVRAVFWGPYAEEASSDVTLGLLNLDYAMPTKVSVKELKIEEVPNFERDGSPKAIYFTAYHYPTFYKFHGSWVSLPSISRMINSLFKRLAEELETEFDSEALRELSSKLEAIGGNVKISRERVKSNLEVPTFSGKVKYYGVLNEGEIELMRWGLKYLPLLGAGASPGMGFGHVQWVEISEPPFDTPVEKLSVNEKYSFQDYI